MFAWWMHEDDGCSGRDNDPIVTTNANAGTGILLLTTLVKPMRPREKPMKDNGTAIRYALYFPFCFFPAPADVPHSSRHGDALHRSRCGRRVRGKISELRDEDGIVESVINTRLPG
jgi:hypothetical protein